MIFGVSPTKDAVVVAETRGSGETIAITSIQFQARSGDDVTDLRGRLIRIFDRSSKSQRSTVALLGSSSGRFKSSVEAIKAEAITERLRPRAACQSSGSQPRVSSPNAHNHPSGDPTPSAEDIALCSRLRLAGDLLGVAVWDFIIVGNASTYYSFLEMGR